MPYWEIKCHAGYDILEMSVSHWGSSVMLDMICWRCECHIGGSSVMLDMTC